MAVRPSRGAVIGAAVTGGLTILLTIVRLSWLDGATTGQWSPSGWADGWASELWASGLAENAWWIVLVVGVLSLAASACLLLIAGRPRTGLVLVAVLATATLWLPPPIPAVTYAIAIVLAVHAGAGWWAAGAVVLTPIVVFTTALGFTGRWRIAVPVSIGICVLLAVVLLISLGRRSGRDRRQRELASMEERRRTESERERVRMARELHDVLAHSLSSISVQANVALHLADRQPERTRDALEGIRDTSRAALDEVRQVLGVLRGDETGPLVPEPDLDALGAMVDDARRLGLAIDVDDRLDPRPGAAVQSAIVRIVREALTNAGRYAPGATVGILLERDGDHAVVEVRDSGAAPGRQPEAGTGAGRGILGMRERATLLGGTLDAGRHGAGFVVTARVPIDQAAGDATHEPGRDDAAAPPDDTTTEETP